VAVKNLVKET